MDNSGYPSAQSSTSSSPASSKAPAILPYDASDHKKFYVISADIRETYDDNVYTSKTNPTSSMTTAVSGSVLFDFPMENTEVSTRLTSGATYIDSGHSFDVTTVFLAHLTHKFSERFGIDLRDESGYFTEPGLFDSTGTLYRNGGYISNRSSLDFSAQWTPLFSTTSSYSNALLFYQDSTIAHGQDSDENAFSQSIGFAIYPKFTLTFAGSIDNVTYNDIARGFTSYSMTSGVSWAALPSLSLSLQGGASMTDTQSTGITSSWSPYAAFSLNWKLGARSSLGFNYTHSIVPTDVTTASGQEADRISTTFSYDINRSFSTHLAGAFTHSDYTQPLIQPGTSGSFTENVLALDTGLSYHINNHFDANIGYTYSLVSSQLAFRDYTRDQIYFGFRATY